MASGGGGSGKESDGDVAMGKVLRLGKGSTGRVYHDYQQELADLEQGMNNYDEFLKQCKNDITTQFESISNDPNLSPSEKKAQLEQLKQQLDNLDEMRQQEYQKYAQRREELMNLVSQGSIEPEPAVNLDSPRNLSETQQLFHAQEDGSEDYNSPIDTEAILCPKQGNARIMFAGTCGLCSVANVLRLAGVDIREGDVIDFASNNVNPDTGEKLCETGHIYPGANGGTSPLDRQKLLEHFGVDSSICKLDYNDDYSLSQSNIDNIARLVSEGRGVIISVHAHNLWYGKKNPVNDLHAVTVVSVKKVDGKVVGFYINDTGVGGTHYYQADRILEALSGAAINVTNSIIR